MGVGCRGLGNSILGRNERGHPKLNRDKRNRDATDQAIGGDEAVWRRLKPGLKGEKVMYPRCRRADLKAEERLDRTVAMRWLKCR
jgi:hypothetical protein